MSGSQVDAELMESTATKCEELGEELAQKLQNLMVHLEPMEKDLQGATGTTFQGVKNTLHTEVRNINRQLDDMAQGIRSSGRDTSASDADSDASLRQAAEGVQGTNETNLLTSGQ